MRDAKKASHHAHPPPHTTERERTESVATEGLDERSEDRTERAYPHAHH